MIVAREIESSYIIRDQNMGDLMLLLGDLVMEAGHLYKIFI